MRVQAGPHRRAAQRDLSEPLERRADAVVALAHLRRVAAELLPEGDRDGVHQVRAPRLDHVVELGRLRLQRVGEPLQRRKEIVRDLTERSEVYC